MSDNEELEINEILLQDGESIDETNEEVVSTPSPFSRLRPSPLNILSREAAFRQPIFNSSDDESDEEDSLQENMIVNERPSHPPLTAAQRFMQARDAMVAAAARSVEEEEKEEKEEEDEEKEDDDKDDEEDDDDEETKEEFCDQSLTSNILNKLKEDGFNETEFSNMLINSNAWIAGSYVLQSVINENWEESDIDIWAIDKPYADHYSPLCTIFSYFKNLGYTYTKNWKAHWNPKKITDKYGDSELINKIKNNMLQYNIKEISSYRRLRSSLSEMWTFKKDGYRKVQIMLLKPIYNILSNFNFFSKETTRYDYVKELKKYISEFDLSSCQIYYTGKTICGLNTNTIQNSKDKMMELTIEAANRQSPNEWIRTLKRLVKYCNRGFSIIWPEKVLKILGFLFVSLYYPNNDYDNYRETIEPIVKEWNEIQNENPNCNIPKIKKYSYNKYITIWFNETNNITVNKNGDIVSLPPPPPRSLPLQSVQENEKHMNNEEAKCKDQINLTHESISQYLRENNGNILLIQPDENIENYNIFCYNIEYFINTINNKNDDVYYECTGRIFEGTNDRSMSSFDFENPYMKLPVGSEGMNAFVPVKDVKSALESQDKIFYVVPELENGEQKMITHTSNYGLARNIRGVSMVSANHCQAGSSILIYRLKVCNGQNCVVSQQFKNRNLETDVEFGDLIQQVPIEQPRSRSVIQRVSRNLFGY